MLHENIIDDGEPLLFSIVGTEDSVHPQGVATIQVPWVTTSYTAYGPESYGQNQSKSLLKVILGGDEYASLTCSGCADEISDYIAVRLNCE
jgi:hypothetical protein